jgi:succinoglycan biosynthesis transport protein ExoP
MTIRPVVPQPPQLAPPTRHFTDHLRVLYKRRWTAGLALLVVFVFGAVSTLKKVPIYEASAQLLIEKEARRATSLNTVLDDQQGYYDDDFYPTQFRILQSRALAWRAIESLGLARTASAAATPTGNAPPDAAASRSVAGRAVAWLSNAVGAPKQIDPPAADETTAQSLQISGFLGGLNVAPVRNTRLVDVKYQAADPVLAERAANAIAEQYIKQSLDSRLQASQEAMEYLKVQLEAQRQKVEASETALQQYKESHDAIALDDKQNTVVTALADISAAKTRATEDRIAKEMTWKPLESLTENRDKLETYPAIMSNPVIQRLKQDLRDLDSRKTDLSGRYGAKDQQMVDIVQKIKDAGDRLQSEEDKVVASVRNDYLTAKAREDSLQQALDKQNQVALSLNRKGIDYAALNREAVSNRTLYDNLLTRAKETGVSGEFKGSNIQIVDRAEVPREPVLPQRGRDLMIAFAEGCLLAVALAFGFEYLDSRIRTPDEIKAALGLPFLGLVPKIPAKADGSHSLLTDAEVPQAFGEAMRAIRTSVIFSTADEGARSIVVTSTAPSEGKTMVSTNLACALAQADQRTLIVDGDMRRPKVHEIFGRPQEPGLSNTLVGTTRLRDAIRVTATPNLFVLPAGHIPPNPAELLGSNRYLELMAELQNQFDWIVIDAPPVMAVTDAAVLAHNATGVLFVIGAEMTPKRNAMAAIEQLVAARAKFIGAVLNRVNVTRHSYYYSPYYRRDYTQAYERAQSGRRS